MSYCATRLAVAALKVRQVGGFPPIPHTPCGIECAAFGVEGMADFVPDDDANGTVVHRSGSLRVEVRRFEICGGKMQRVLQRQFTASTVCGACTILCD